ncbi:DNA-binding domain-containing protein [Pseudomonas sp. MWU13-2100]|uniref:HvfC/BufC N-terminal domain-containing protein n=1 Tax=Pseudomonas sp. MWU13-2100 TaxID=2935075 RepID=UPI00200C3D48|nr:DNA-binding domain-containing protein [Pseudomonas sp. MWU13-2100]
MNLGQWQRELRNWLVSASAETAANLGAKAGLSVYQNNYRTQLLGCLEEAFPQVRAWIGTEAFFAAAVTHIDQCPPHAWTLDAYPQGFDQTLARRFPDNPEVHELAWIERALDESFVAADAEPLSVEALAGVDWETACLRLAPSLRSHALSSNAESIWSALSEGLPPPAPERLAEAAGLLVWRRQLTVRLRPVEMLEHQALLHLQENGSFSGLCEWLVERLGETSGIAKAGALLANWLAGELIVGADLYKA